MCLTHLQYCRCSGSIKSYDMLVCIVECFFWLEDGVGLCCGCGRIIEIGKGGVWLVEGGWDSGLAFF